MDHDGLTDGQIREILSLRRVAVVGMSRNPAKDAHRVPRYLMENGYEITPVNPAASEILGLRCYESVSDVPGEIDIVDVFRPSDQVVPFVQDAISKGPKAVWLQEGIHNPKAEGLARDAGITVVFDRCMLAEHRRLAAP